VDQPFSAARRNLHGLRRPGASSTYAQYQRGGSITGQYTDVNSVVHGFLRSPDGSFTTFDIPALKPFLPESINAAGAITGSILTRSTRTQTLTASAGPRRDTHSFRCPWGRHTGRGPLVPTPLASTRQVRSQASTSTRIVTTTATCGPSDGTLTTFDVPGQSTAPSPSVSIRPRAITGEYSDASYVGHGFLRAPDGTLTTFDAPGANTATLALALMRPIAITEPLRTRQGVSRLSALPRRYLHP